MLKHLLAMTLILSTTMAMAEDRPFAVGGGLSINTVETDGSLGSGVDEEVSVGWNVGIRGIFDLDEKWSFRTAALLQEKTFKYSLEDDDFDASVTGKLLSVGVPLLAQFKINDQFAIFGGYSADININDYCNADGDIDSCYLEEEPESIIHHAVIGGSVWANDQIDIDVSYQRALSDSIDKIKVHSFMVQAFFQI